MLKLHALMGVRHSTYIHTDLPLMNVPILYAFLFPSFQQNWGAAHLLPINHLPLSCILGLGIVLHRVALFLRTYIFNEHDVLASCFFLFSFFLFKGW
jgi:hypothetical protein